MIKEVLEQGRDVEILTECDVLVVGGGPAGMAAAIGAADAGAKTVIVERYGCLGGNITVAAVECPSWYRQEKTTMPGGVGKEIEDRMKLRGAARPVSFRPSTGLSYDTEIFKQMADDMIKDHGITPIYHCLGATPYLENGVIKGVITESKSGRKVIFAKRVVDCTGDADIAARAGAPYEQGDPETGKVMPGTLKFFATDVDLEMLEKAMDEDPQNRDPYHHKLFHKVFDRARQAGEPDIPNANTTMHYTPIPPCDLNINIATFDRELDGTDVESLTRSEIKLRRTVRKLFELFNKYGGDCGLGGAKLRNFAMAVGVRETRRIKASYALTRDDLLKSARFDDTIGVFPVYMDGEGVKEIPYSEAYVQVPFRITVPQKVENLLVAGRCISCERSVVPGTRQMDFCMVTGQAAGVASALSIRQNAASAEVDIPAVQKELERQGLRVF